MWKEMNGITNDDGQGGCTVYLLFYFHSTTLFYPASTSVPHSIRLPRMDQQVLQCLQSTLSPEGNVRKHAEEQLKQLFAIPGMSCLMSLECC